MRRSDVLVLVGTLVLAGCAAQQTVPEYTPPPSGTQTEGQVRARVHTELGASYYEIGNLGVAIEELNEALRADPGYGPAYNVLGLVYMELREDVFAQQHFQRALKINPLDSDANNNYGWFLCQRKREDEAIHYFMAALKNPLYANPDKSYVNAGVCSRRRGDLAGAQDFFLKALKLRPNQPQALFQMADIAYARGDYAETRTYLNRYTQVAAVTPEVLWLGVRVERRLGDRNAEASYGVQLRKNFPNSKEAKALLAGQYE